MAIDISEAALAVARRNAAQHGVADRIDFRLGDRLEPVAGEGPFDAIISNPPYIPTGQIDHLEPASAIMSPGLALDGGPTGLDMVARLIEESVPLLKPGGHLILEIGSDQEKPVRALIESQSSLRLRRPSTIIPSIPGSFGQRGWNDPGIRSSVGMETGLIGQGQASPTKALWRRDP